MHKNSRRCVINKQDCSYFMVIHARDDLIHIALHVEVNSAACNGIKQENHVHAFIGKRFMTFTRELLFRFVTIIIMFRFVHELL